MSDAPAPPEELSDRHLMEMMANHVIEFAADLAAHYAGLLFEDHANLSVHRIYRKKGAYGYRVTVRSTREPGVVSIEARCNSAPALGYLLDYVEKINAQADLRAQREHTLRGTFRLLEADAIPCLNAEQ